MKKLGAILLSFLLFVGVFPTSSFAAASTFDADFNKYLKSVSQTRGFEVTKDDVEYSLSLYDESLENFDTIADLEDFLGEPIAADLHNVQDVYADFDLDKTSLNALLKENGQSLDDYVYLDDLYEDVGFYLEGDDWYEDDESYDEEDASYDDELSEEDLSGLLSFMQSELGLTSEELNRIEAHFTSLEDELSNEATLNRLDQLGERLAAFEDFDTATELSADQIAELMSIYKEMLSIFHLDAKFALVQGGNERPLSLTDLINLEELKNASLKISLYTTDGKFLADMVITGDMFNSDIITDTGKEVEKSAEAVAKPAQAQKPAVEKKQEPVKKQTNGAVQKTVKGGKLPETASNYVTNTLIGLVLVAAGFVLFRKVRRA
ncbi:MULTISPECIES: processed acidic surface protein [Priestia]|jgi:processed acidic surface protein|uniref:LPXTG-motif cell wall anchor domain protein n=3 Tax=Priestia TaxID=2800373 RepID=D5DXA7_PRIM1|nr:MULTISPECIES: processed acidic surface protein [Priestia]AVX09139.1 processed acidic surface protein [Bacillus sp. Y-01]KQU16793.1 peptidase [Bacillus sp. Leaf75]KRF56572.1 peptidase [Bacillus sp. Soil531]MBZ5480565.1 processed acidic surface protein [Bacillus sp. T_4]MCF6797059.1 processed acidic surface protein [Bacillus sp. ET1]MDH6653848.1 processed acidic surface protein [Bacillus sp. PvP124]MDP9576039.1 processed acidic surface protein [Bacillus sp. 1751]RFB41688.1 processed acidic